MAVCIKPDQELGGGRKVPMRLDPCRKRTSKVEEGLEQVIRKNRRNGRPVNQDDHSVNKFPPSGSR